jgi:hypothetical protein
VQNTSINYIYLTTFDLQPPLNPEAILRLCRNPPRIPLGCPGSAAIERGGSVRWLLIAAEQEVQ